MSLLVLVSAGSRSNASGQPSMFYTAFALSFLLVCQFSRSAEARLYCCVAVRGERAHKCRQTLGCGSVHNSPAFPHCAGVAHARIPCHFCVVTPRLHLYCFLVSILEKKLLLVNPSSWGFMETPPLLARGWHDNSILRRFWGFAFFTMH